MNSISSGALFELKRTFQPPRASVAKPSITREEIARETARKISVRWRAGTFRQDGGVVEGMTSIIHAAIVKATSYKWE